MSDKDFITKLIDLLRLVRDGGAKDDSPDMWQAINEAIAEGEVRAAPSRFLAKVETVKGIPVFSDLTFLPTKHPGIPGTMTREVIINGVRYPFQADDKLRIDPTGTLFINGERATATA